MSKANKFSLLQKFFPMKALILGGLIYELVRGLSKSFPRNLLSVPDSPGIGEEKSAPKSVDITTIMPLYSPPVFTPPAVYLMVLSPKIAYSEQKQKKAAISMPNSLPRIYHYLYQLQLSPASKGFYQLAYALYLIQTDSAYLTAVTKCLYPDVARQFETTAAAVERNIRRMVAEIWHKPTSPVAHLPHPTSARALAILTVALSDQTPIN